MTKKISGNRPVSPIKTDRLSQSQSVKSIQNIERTENVSKTNRAKGATRMISAKEKQELIKMVNEEADKLFGNSNISESKRKKVEEAVKMTIDAAFETEDSN